MSFPVTPAAGLHAVHIRSVQLDGPLELLAVLREPLIGEPLGLRSPVDIGGLVDVFPTSREPEGLKAHRL